MVWFKALICRSHTTEPGPAYATQHRFAGKAGCLPVVGLDAHVSTGKQKLHQLLPKIEGSCTIEHSANAERKSIPLPSTRRGWRAKVRPRRQARAMRESAEHGPQPISNTWCSGSKPCARRNASCATPDTPRSFPAEVGATVDRGHHCSVRQPGSPDHTCDSIAARPLCVGLRECA